MFRAPGGAQVIGFRDVPGSEKWVGSKGNRHQLPERKNLNIKSLTPEQANNYRIDEAKSWDAIRDLTDKEKSGAKLTKKEKALLREAEKHAAVDGDVLAADARKDHRRGEKYEDGKKEFFENFDESSGIDITV